METSESEDGRDAAYRSRLLQIEKVEPISVDEIFEDDAPAQIPKTTTCCDGKAHSLAIADNIAYDLADLCPMTPIET